MKTTPRTPAPGVRPPCRPPVAGVRTIARSRPSPALAQAQRRIRGKPGFLASLTQEQLNVLFEQDWPEVLGRGPRRRPRG